MKLATKRAMMRRLWNEGDMSHTDIAAVVGLPVDTCAKWLAQQDGYPGIIGGKQAVCAVCGLKFVTWGRGQGGRVYCSQVHAAEGRRAQYQRSTAKSRGTVRRCLSRRYVGLSPEDRRLVKMAIEEARERGTTRDAVLAEWKFVPQRRTA